MNYRKLALIVLFPMTFLSYGDNKQELEALEYKIKTEMDELTEKIHKECALFREHTANAINILKLVGEEATESKFEEYLNKMRDAISAGKDYKEVTPFVFLQTALLKCVLEYNSIEELSVKYNIQANDLIKIHSQLSK